MKRLLFTTALCVLFANFAIAQTRTLDLGEFSKISVGQAFDVLLIPSNRYEIIVPESISDDVFRIVDSSLRIHDPSQVSNQNRNEEPIIVLFASLKQLTVSGAAKVWSEGEIVGNHFSRLQLSGASNTTLTLLGSDIVSIVSGAANLNISGTVRKHQIQGSGAANIHAEKLDARTTTVFLSGAANARVFTQVANGRLSGASSLRLNSEAQNHVSQTRGTSIRRIDNMAQNFESTRTQDMQELQDELDEGLQELQRELSELSEELNEWSKNFGNTTVTVNSSGKINVNTNNSPKRRKFNPSYGYFDFGFSSYGQDFFQHTLPEDYKNMELKQNVSFAFNMNLFQYGVRLGRSDFGIGTGVGIGWNTYRFLDESVIPSGDKDLGIFVIEPYDGDEDRRYRKSLIRTTWLKVPLYVNYQQKRFFATAGVVGNVRLGASSKQVYSFNGRNRDKTRDNFYLNAFRADAEVRFGYRNVGFFATYSLTELFLKNRGPELIPFSFGITLGV
ncbi:MAG: DUF2807 domain-containing protein [Bacteroidales bacterium]|nr:DUF2807 domain-containing protein [Bacteroidales bacterium]